MALQALLCLNAVKLHIKSRFLSLAFPILLIRDRPLILVPDCLMTGVSPQKEHS